MATRDTKQMKESMLSFIRLKGPSLPIHLAKEIGSDTLFTSAFLSELLSEQKLKMSHLRVGSSPLYLLEGQEPKLEKFSKYLNSKEKEAFVRLKEKGILMDREQEPAIRVALRSIRDFAIPVTKDDILYWKYLTAEFPKDIPSENVPEIKKEEVEEVSKEDEKPTEKVEDSSIESGGDSDIVKEEILEVKKEENLEIFDSLEKTELEEKTKVERPKKGKFSKKTSPKANEKFFNRVKEYLLNQRMELLDIVGFSKEDITLKVKDSDKEYLLVAYNKKSIREEDILKAHKKASVEQLPYKILSLGGPLKKLMSFIEAVRNLDDIEKIE